MSTPLTSDDSLQFICTLVQAAQTLKTAAGEKVHWPVTHLITEAMLYFWATREVPIDDQSRPRSAAAARSPGSSLVYDCAVPLGLLAQEMLTWPPTPETVRQFLDDYLLVCLLTIEEAQRLSAMNLRSHMPEGWHWGDDLLARYKTAGIEILGLEKGRREEWGQE